MAPSRSPASRRWVVFLPFGLVLLQNALYGFGDPISKAAYESVPVYSLLSVRYAIALAFLLLLFGKRVVAGLKNSKVSDWILPSLCIGGAYVVGNIAIDLTAATAVAFLRSLATVMTPLLAWIFFRKKISPRQIPLYVLSVVGLYLLCGLGGLSGFGLGEVCSLLSALLLAGSLVFGEKALENVDPLTLTTVQTAASAVMALLCALIFDHGFELSGATPKVWAIIVYMALGCTVSGYLLQNRALALLSARTVALLQCICPVMTAIFSYLLLGEKLSLAGLAGALLLLLCVAGVTFFGEPDHQPDHQPAPQKAPTETPIRM